MNIEYILKDSSKKSPSYVRERGFIKDPLIPVS